MPTRFFSMFREKSIACNSTARTSQTKNFQKRSYGWGIVPRLKWGAMKSLSSQTWTMKLEWAISYAVYRSPVAVYKRSLTTWPIVVPICGRFSCIPTRSRRFLLVSPGCRISKPFIWNRIAWRICRISSFQVPWGRWRFVGTKLRSCRMLRGIYWRASFLGSIRLGTKFQIHLFLICSRKKSLWLKPFQI